MILKEMLKMLKMLKILSLFILSVSSLNIEMCNNCKMVVSTKNNINLTNFRKLLCNELPIEYTSVCDYAVQSEYHTFSYFLANNYTSSEICSQLKYC